MTKRILCLAGGGVKAVASAKVLEQFDLTLKNIDPNLSIYNYFDVFAGTSAGSLIVAALVYCKLDASELVTNLFTENNINKIMDGNNITKYIRYLGNLPKYDGVGKRKIIEKYVGSTLLSETPKDVIITSYQLGLEKPVRARLCRSSVVDSSKEPILFTSYNKDLNITVLDACDASSAAPTYFPAVDIRVNPKEVLQCVDGGLVANDPSLYAYVETKTRYPNEDIVLFSLGTGVFEKNGIPVNNIGVKSWLLNEDIISLIISGVQLHNYYILEKLLRSKYLYINGHVTSYSIDDTTDENFKDLQANGLKWFTDNKDKILQWILDQIQVKDQK